MKYLKKFNTHSDYEAFTGSTEFVRPNVSYVVNEDEVNFNPYEFPYLTFTAEEANSTIKLNRVGTATTLTNAVLKYSLNNGKWNDFSIISTTIYVIFDSGYNIIAELTEAELEEQYNGDIDYAVQQLSGNTYFDAVDNGSITITLDNVGDSVRFKGANTTLGVSASDYHQFVMTGNISAKGDVTSLLNETGGNCTLQTYAFYGLFRNCKSLTTAPELPSTTLKNYCYSNMFQGCTSLTSAPELPATTLANYCYQYMFKGCTSLTSAPELPAPAFASNCYSYMFSGCSNLSYIKALFVASPATGFTTNWVSGVKSTGTFEKSAFATWNNVTGVNGVPSNWTLIEPQYEFLSNNELLTFTAEEANSTITFNRVGTSGSLANANLQYSTDGGNNWYSYTLGDTIPLSNVGDSVKFKGTNTSFAIDAYSYHKFVMTGKISSHGKITSLLTLRNVDYLPSNAYNHLFVSCTSLTSAPELPATSLASNCYAYMFNGCTSLTAAPELPATVLATGCYQYMFNGCTSLTSAPELPATTLNSSCYNRMFYGCTSLTVAPELPATVVEAYCYSNMFQGCTSLTSAPPELPARNLVMYCYQYMFYGCSSLTAVPELPATTLAEYCYCSMFSNCTSLTSAPELPATNLLNRCYQYMFQGCTSLTSATLLAVNIAATYSPCERMFYGCKNLNYINAKFITAPAISYTTEWVNGVKATGTFVKNSEANWSVGISGIPNGWTVETES